MKQKLFTLFFALVASAGTMFAAVVIDGIAYNLNDETFTAVVTSGGAYTGEVVIPSSITYNQQVYSVTSIGNSAFFCYSGLTSVTIPNSVISIGNDAFTACSGLTSIVVANGNSVYDSRNNCNAIIETASNTLVAGCMNTTIPNSVTSIGNNAFAACSGLTNVTIPNSVTSIENYAFAACSGLTSVTIGNSVTSIGNDAFFSCTGLTSVTIPNSVTSIGYGAFSGCIGLTSVVVETGNIVYDSRENCNAIIETATNTLITGCQNTTIPNSVTSIGNNAFWSCSGLTSVTIPNSVTSIENYAFAACSGLTSVTIPNSVTSIKNYAFDACSGLTSITCEATTPPSCIGNSFNGVDKSIPLYVLAESADLYKAADVWRDFANILPISAEGIDKTNVNDKSLKVVQNDQVLILRGDKTYTITGQEVR